MGLVACRVSDLVDSPQSGARLQFSVQPTSVDYGEPISPAVKVSVLNDGGRIDTAFAEAVTIALAPNAAGAVLTGTTVVVADGGVATFDDLEVDRPGQAYVLQASARQHPMALSAPFAVVADPPPPPPQATRLAFVVPPSNVQAGSAIAPAVQVAAQDNGGSTVASYTGTITLAIGDNPGGGVLSGTISAVAANGVAMFANVRISEAGNGYTLTAAASGLTGATSAAFNVTAQPPPPPPPATQLAFTVQPSTTDTGSSITPAVQVAARDASGNLVPTYSGTITIAIANNPAGGTLAGATTAAAVGGVAQFANLRINRAGTGYTLRATASGLTAATSATFNITAPPPPPPPPATQLAFTVQPTTTEAGSNISPPVQVAARDASGNPVTGYTGTITIAIGSNPGGGTLAGTTSSVASNGVATFAGLRIDRAGNGYTLTAAASGLTGATSAAFNVTAQPPPPPPPATQLAFTVQPSTTDTGTTITPAVQVAARDASGNLVTTYSGTITIVIANNPAGGTLAGTTSVTAVGGIAQFANLRINRAGTGYTLRATASGLTAATSVAFDITAPPPPPPPPPPPATQLAFTVQPTTTEAGSSISPPVQVAARDASGNVVTGYTGTITIAIGSNPGGGTLAGTTSSVANNGVATFAGLRIDRAGNGYTLTAAASGLSGATSVSFNITAPPPPPPPPPVPTGLRFIVQPSNTGVNQPINPPVQVMAVDFNGNQVTGFTGAITIDLAPNVLGATAYGTLTVNAVNGIATFSNIRINLVGVDFRLRAMFAGQTPIVTSNAFIVLL